ncbi:unnamed protein product [Moneuplotes crassus]|uniref:Uncharacterized protein n=1 Tax=Euplotes crassus TaxID=5936 RepID=A0AAD1X6H5_EUPCR|nr:unnamed protein product [Moneuplotes crassus]
MEESKSKIPSGYSIQQDFEEEVQRKPLLLDSYQDNMGINESTEEDSFLGSAQEPMEYVTAEQRILYEGMSPQQKAGLVSRILFFWINPLISYSKKNKLDKEIIGKLPESQATEVNSARLQEKWEKWRNSKGNTLFWALIHCYWKEFLFAIFLNLISACLDLFSPFFFKEIMTFVQDDTGEYPRSRAIMFVFLTFATQLIGKTIFENARFYQLQLGARASHSLGSLVYTKTLKISPATSKKYKKGDIVNFIQVDAKKFIFLAESLPSVARLPLVLLFSIGLLFYYFKYSFFAGLSVLIVMILINYGLAKLTFRFQNIVMKKLDKRMNIMSECLDNIQLIKLNAWGEKFTEKINEARFEEIYALSWRFFMSVLNAFFINGTYPILALVSFTAAIFGAGFEISIPVAVASIQSMNLLKSGARWLPFFFGMLIEFLVSMKRIQSFLLSDEIDLKTIQDSPEPASEALIIQKANFSWGFKEEKKVEKSSEEESEKNGDSSQASLLEEFKSEVSTEYKISDTVILKDLDISIKQGEFVAIIGEVGSGKTSLIHSIIGDMVNIDQFTLEKYQDEYAQSPEDSTLNQELIDRFNKSLEANKDQVYRDPPIKINGKISLIEQKPWIQNKTIRDNILFGETLVMEKYNETIEYSQLGRDLSILEGGDLTEIGEKGINLSGGQKARISIARAIYSDFDIVLMDDPLSALDAHVKHKIFKHLLTEKLKDRTRIMVTHAIDFLDKVDRIIVMDKGEVIFDGSFEEIKSNEYFNVILSHMDKDESEGEGSSEDDKDDGNSELQCTKNYLSEKGSTITTNENEEEVNVEWATYLRYFLYNKVTAMLIIVGAIMLIIAQSSTVAFDVTLLKWLNYITEEGKNNTKMFILILVFIGIFITFFIIAVHLIFVSSLKLSKTLFKNMNQSIFNAPINLYFDKTPTGVILNRFSKDLNVVDNAIPYAVRYVIWSSLLVLSAIAVAVYNVVWVLIAIPFMFLIIYWLFKSYIKALKEVARVESITNSPVLTHLGESMLGSSTIRAFKKTQMFRKNQFTLQDFNLSSMIMSKAVKSWFNIRLHMIQQFLTLGSTFYCVMFKDSLDPVIIAIMMVYLIMIQLNLTLLFQMTSNMEEHMVSFTRCLNICGIPQEATQRKVIPCDADGNPWISKGSITFKDYCVRYRPETELVLQDINLEIQSGEKIGVVGRTGAGKSTLCIAICRIIEKYSGSILIDGVDISKVGLADLRSRITVIPQESTLFKGTLRFNLDPDGKSSEEEIMRLLDKAGLIDLIMRDGKGLDFEIESKGDNLSSGEKQLICICRAILRKNRIVIMDEATANIDIMTETIVQSLIKEEFTDSTVITVAHRLNTVLNSDKILVLGFGKVLEYDTPERLRNDETSEFYSLLNEFKQ